MHGDGTQTRDYVYVDDVVSAMIAAATAPGLNHLSINIGSGTETSVIDLFHRVVEVTGSQPEVVTNPKSDPGVSRMCASLVLAREKLGYQPRFSITEGLRLTMERDARLRKEATRPANR
jgi:UDP-glucose 4-epimerase